jgi:hypothetical protein
MQKDSKNFHCDVQFTIREIFLSREIPEISEKVRTSLIT